MSQTIRYRTSFAIKIQLGFGHDSKVGENRLYKELDPSPFLENLPHVPRCMTSMR